MSREGLKGLKYDFTINPLFSGPIGHVTMTCTPLELLSPSKIHGASTDKFRVSSAGEDALVTEAETLHSNRYTSVQQSRHLCVTHLHSKAWAGGWRATSNKIEPIRRRSQMTLQSPAYCVNAQEDNCPSNPEFGALWLEFLREPSSRETSADLYISPVIRINS